MKVVKRSGKVIDFNRKKIQSAIEKAWLEIHPMLDDEVITSIADKVEGALAERTPPYSVEEIQDLVELRLMETEPSVAKRFILYRHEKAKTRVTKARYKYLSDEFLSPYKHKEDPLNELGSFVFYRTYSRYLPEEGRRERWWETVARAVDYNCSLSPTTTRVEAEQLFDNIYNLKQQLSGRTLYTGGTEASKKYLLSNFNCSMTVVENIDDFCDLFYVLMVGTGAGVGIQKKYVEKLPLFRTNIDVYHEEWQFTPKDFREDITTSEVNGDTLRIIVGDSKEGFIEALRLYLNVLTSHSYRSIAKILINYDYVRPKGERLVVFGGHASGHDSMKNMIHKIHMLIGQRKGEGSKVPLRPIDVMDIANIIGENVVSGGKL